MKLKALMVAGMALVGVLGLSQDTWAGGTCPDGSQRDTYKTSLAECNLPEEEEIKATNGGKDLMGVITQAINVIVGVVGVIAVVAIVLGGIYYVTSTGDAAKTKRAMSTIIYGVVGLVIATVAFALVNWVLVAIFSTKQSSGGEEGEEGSSKDSNSSLVIDYSDIA